MPDSAPTPCPFCSPTPDRVFYRDAWVIGLWDAFPVTPGHALLVPIRHIPTWFDASVEEQTALMRAIDVSRQTIESNHDADGYNIGINSGEAAGQTVFHLHVHVIPRRHGDVPDPRGGIRHVIAEKANYLREPIPPLEPPTADRSHTHSLVTGGETDPFLPHLKRHLALSKAADIAVAFTLRSGLQLIYAHLQDLLERGGALRILTGDYLGATDPDALLRLLDLEGEIECRVFQTDGTSAAGASASAFHPKAYLFHHRDSPSVALIGSSNLSQSALKGGVEWNYRVLESRDPAGWTRIAHSFKRLFYSPNTLPLTPEWIECYRMRRPTAARTAPATQVIPDSPVVIPIPHSIQQEALAALKKTREEGRHAALVVLATGLGKTWLSAFDSVAARKVLFVAHREEILTQALATFRAIRPHDSLGRYTGDEKSSSVAVLVASIQTLSRQAHLDRFAKDEFDYIIIDEFHHAEAKTYRRLIEHFTPKFLLGLTATPERTDGADLLALCDNNLVYRCDLTEGIHRNLLCPYRYFGVPDDVNYRNIRWRNKKFDETALTNAVATQARATNALEQYRKRGGRRTLAFCVSQRHADFMAEFLVAHGVAAKAVHAGPTSAPRAESLEALQDGSLSVLCAVDMFNEGVDVPELDTIMMLRPTESRILWLQQFGRGLRRSDPTKILTVIDYIGNHRSFMLKPQALFGLPDDDRAVADILDDLDAGTADLPPGCEVTYELEAKNILRALLRLNGSAIELLTRRYQDFKETLGLRPTAAELAREGYNLRVLRPSFSSWLGFVKSQGDLSEAETQAYQETKEFLHTLETTDMSKSYKMLVLLAMLNRNQVPGALSLSDLAEEVEAMARHDTRIANEIETGSNDGTQHLQNLLKTNPIEAWVGGRGTGGISYFKFDGDTLTSRLTVRPSHVQATQELIREIAEWRLAEYFNRPSQKSPNEWALKVIHSNDQPILVLPPRKSNPDLPQAWTEVRVDDETVKANFARIAINVVRRLDSDTNVLPEILKNWFGPDAGRPGTQYRVILTQGEGSWSLRPLVTRTGSIVPYKVYRRPEIAPLLGLPYSERYWGQGFVRQGQHTFLFVTLDKTDQTAAFQYKDHFESAADFQWQSQNRTSQDSSSGESIQAHQAQGITVHLFVRAKAKTPDGRGAPFYYCGPVNFVSWTDEKPITVMWQLSVPVPRALWNELGVPNGPTAEAGKGASAMAP